MSHFATFIPPFDTFVQSFLLPHVSNFILEFIESLFSATKAFKISSTEYSVFPTPYSILLTPSAQNTLSKLNFCNTPYTLHNIAYSGVVSNIQCKCITYLTSVHYYYI